jgi:hypothetical protein
MPPEANTPLPSMSAHQTAVRELEDKYACFNLQIVAAEEVLGEDLTRETQGRGRNAHVQMKIALLELHRALEELDKVQ